MFGLVGNKFVANSKTTKFCDSHLPPFLQKTLAPYDNESPKYISSRFPISQCSDYVEPYGEGRNLVRMDGWRSETLCGEGGLVLMFLLAKLSLPASKG